MWSSIAGLWRRLRSSVTPAVPARSAAAPAQRQAPVRIVGVDDAQAAALAGELFQRKFGQPIPAFPRHFVAMIGERCAGYVHYSAWQGDYLCGGLCIDERAYRALPPPARSWVRERGGVAEIMLRAAHAQLTDGAAIWGYVGDKQAEAVDRRVGFEKVAEPYLFVIWQHPLSATEKAQRIAAAIRLGPF